MTKNFDILIIGGGMVGLTLAKALSKNDLKIAVFDYSAPSDSPSKTELLRVSAISRASQNILEQLDCWNDTLTQNACAYDKMDVWDTQGNANLSFDAADLGEPDLGHIIPNAHIRLALWQALQNSPNVTLIAPIEMHSARWLDDAVEVQLTNGETYQGKLAVAADGANSWLRQQKPITIVEKPYEHTALVANIGIEYDHGHCARQAFLETGPLAFLPMYDKNQCSIVWSTSAAHAKQLKQLDEASFIEQLQLAFGDGLGELSLLSDRLTFPLVSRHANRYVQDGLALMGDAAHTIHPLAGQGVNLGLLDACSLAQTIEAGVVKNLDFSQEQVLRPYERWRRSENQLMLDAMMGLKTLFSGDQKILNFARGFGVNLINQNSFIKSQLIQRAMGLVGDLPKLAKAQLPEL